MDLISREEKLPKYLRESMNLAEYNRVYVRKCEWCKNKFDIYQARSLTQWSYKTKDLKKIFCSYNCMCEYDRAKGKKTNERR